MTFPFTIGETRLGVEVFQKQTVQPTFINVHEDETTSVEAGRKNIEEFGGRLIHIAHEKTRLITFKLAGQACSFDPNRIFSDAGIRATLEKHSAYSAEAHVAIKTFAKAYLHQFLLDREPLIIALHNTVDGIFSVESFAPKGDLSMDAAAIHVHASRSKFDFFYVTEPVFFQKLKDRHFNVVLQNNAAVTDDGSLSVHFAKKGIPYINVEAEMRHLSEQVEMLKAVREIIAGK